MAQAFELFGKVPARRAMEPEKPPTLLWGAGAPDGDADPFLGANKGTLYLQTDASDDAAHAFVKVDEGGDDNDWVAFSLVGHTHA